MRLTSLLLLAIAVLAPRGALAFGMPPSSGNPAPVHVHLDEPVGGALAGFGGQFNPNLEDPINRRAMGLRASGIAQVEHDTARLAPQHVRIFFDEEFYSDCDRMRSFVDAVDLAQRDGATVNITYWKGYGWLHPRAQMRRFANVIETLTTGEPRSKAMVACGIDLHPRHAVRYVTIQNEPNNHRFSQISIEGHRPGLYAQVYRDFDADLRGDGDRRRVKIIGGDLVEGPSGTRVATEQDWLRYMAKNLGDVVDGYSIHVYWDYDDPQRGQERLQETRDWVDELPPRARLPLYVTEFGVHGGEAPDDGRRAFQEGMFDLLAANLGFRATSKWDAYASVYDLPARVDGACDPADPSQIRSLARTIDAAERSGRFAMISTPARGFAREPSFSVTRLMTHVVPVGAHAVSVSGGDDHHVVTVFRRGGQVSVVIANDTGTPWTASLDGLPADRSFFTDDWTGGGISLSGMHRTDGSGRTSLIVPAHGFAAITTRAPGLK